MGEGASASDRESAQLRHELAATKEYLQSLVEQQDAANEELRSANEEVLSSNEELQSTNEELETAKEELQSLNEELTTVNEQLQNRNLELNKLSNDLTNLLTSTTIPVVMVGSDLRIRRLTAPATKVMNLLPTDVGRPIGDIKTNVDVPDLEALIAGVIENVQVREQEVQDRQGHWYALRLYPYRTADHQIDGAVVVLLDIDQIKRAEEEVREARNYARAIVETVREPLLVLDEELRVQTANKSFYETFGVTLEETEGRLVFDLGDRQWDIPALRKLLEEVLPEKKAFQDFEVEHAFPHVGRKTMLLNARVLHRANRPAKILLAIEDVSERKAAELMRIQAEALRRADRRKDQFLATLAHELRNPLSPICNSVQILRLVGDDAAQAGQTRDMLERQVNHLVRIVDDLLNMSRIAEGKMELRKERVVLATIVTTAVENSRSLIEGCGHQLTVTLPPEPVDLEADPDRLEQVLANLLNNAAKFTEAGGQIRLTAELVSGGREPPGDVVIRVADTGIGISAELLPRIFEMFTQGDQSLERTRGGLGVGLALVKSLVQMHGGTVEACSAGPGQGSQFSVRLPLAPKGGQPHASGPQQGRGQRLAGSARRRILVVDDNQDTAKSLGMLLAFMGHEVRIAHDGPGALEAAMAFVPEVALLDIGMPGMNGYEVARHIREQPGLGHVFLAALTGYGTDEDRRRSQEAGFDRHLVKPVKLHALEELLAVRERDA